MAKRVNRDFGEHNDYDDHGDRFKQVRRVPLEVIGNRFLILITIAAALYLLIYFHVI